MAEEKTVKFKATFDVGKAIEEAGSLKSAIRQAREEFTKMQNASDTTKEKLDEQREKIDALNDAADRAKFSAGSFADRIAALPGPLGKLGGGLKSVGDSFATFGVGLTGILGIVGLLVTAFFAIKNALGKTEEGTKALSAVTTAFNKVLAPILAIFEKLGLIVLPYVTKGLEAVGNVMNRVAKFFRVSTDKIDETTASLEKNNEAANKLKDDEEKRIKELEEKRKKIEEIRRKREEKAEKDAEEARKRQEDRDRRDEAAYKRLAEAYKSTLSEKNQELLTIEENYEEARKDLIRAGNYDFTLIEEQRRVLIAKVNKKYDDEEDKKQAEKLKKFIDFLKEKREKEIKDLDDNLTLEEARLKSLQEGTKEYFAQQRVIEDAAYAKQVDKAKGNKKELEIIDANHKKVKDNINKAEKIATLDHLNSIANAYASFGKNLQALAGENKKLAIAGLLIEQAAGVASIIINTQKAVMQAGGPLSPLGIANIIAGAASVAAAIAATIKGIRQINQVDTKNGTGGSQSAGAPAPTYGGAPQAMAAPQIQTGVGATPGLQIAETLAMTTQKPVRAYVISSDISSAQALDRKTNRAATFNLG